MRILVLGGTAWVGREVAALAVADGHEVVCLARGTAGEVAEGSRLVVGDRARDNGLDGVAGKRWDVVIDVARQPGHVRRSVRDLADVGHYVLVSSISAYLPPTRAGLDESAPLRDALAADVMESTQTYGEAKVACEQYVSGAFPGRSTLLRSGLIGGPGDPTDRTTYWPHRFHTAAASGTSVLVPDAADLETAVIDVRDLTAWMLACGVRGIDGVFNIPGPGHTFSEHLASAAEVGGFSGTSVAAAEDWLTERQVEPWFGSRSLPIWLTGEDRFLTSASTAAALAAGLVMRPLAETLADGLDWRRNEPGRVWASGLTVTEEQELLADLGTLT